MAHQELESDLRGNMTRNMQKLGVKNKKQTSVMRDEAEDKKKNKAKVINQLDRDPSIQLEPQAMPQKVKQEKVKLNLVNTRWRTAAQSADGLRSKNIVDGGVTDSSSKNSKKKWKSASRKTMRSKTILLDDNADEKSRNKPDIKGDVQRPKNILLDDTVDENDA